ncbi:MAG: UPF0262 family protein [Rhodospirillaceae bacterium]|nr:UPF0262 family protein [Rhodospirillaceae bacterium]
MTAGDGPPAGSGDAARGSSDQHRRSFVKIQLDEKSFLRRRPEVEHEREVALFDLLEENLFILKNADTAAGPFHLRLGLTEDRLVFDVRDTADARLREIVLAVKPFRMIIKDYFLVCESYFDAIKAASASEIEAIDMGRRGLHNEGAQMLKERLAEHVELDQGTSRRFFTLLCVLHMRG